MDAITSATAECFDALMQIRDHQGPLPSPEAVHQQLRGLIEGVRETLRQDNVPDRDVTDIVYALVALTDEIALSRPEPLRSYWMRAALQISYFNENRAGEGFFQRLGQVRGDARRTDVLRVYYLCLLFGFQGQYAVQGGDVELLRLIETLRAELERRIGTVRELSPSSEPPDEPAIRTPSRNPAGWIALGIFAIALTVFVGLKVSLSARVSSLGDRVRTLATTSDPQK